MGKYDFLAVLFVLACLGIGWFFRDVIFGDSNKVIDAPIDKDTQYDMRWGKRPYNRNEIYDQELDK